MTMFNTIYYASSVSMRSANARIYFVAVLLVAFAASAQSSNNNQTGEPPVVLEVFKGPEAVNPRPPPYPWTERAAGRDGWVVLKFMVDPQGKPYEICVSDSSGNIAFKRAAIKTLQTWTFQPASLDGKPVDAAHKYKFYFVLTDGGARQRGASESFVRRYRLLRGALKAGDRQLADELFAKLKVENLYEEAYYHFARYSYYLRWGDESQQLFSLRGAIAEESRADYLPDKLFVAALQSLLPLEIRAKNFADVMEVWEKLKANGADGAVAENVRAAINEIEALRTDNRAYSVPGAIGENHSWFYSLFKNRFRFLVSNGQISDIKLRCDKKFVFFKYSSELQYEVSDKFGPCHMEVIGEPGAKFELIQS